MLRQFGGVCNQHFPGGGHTLPRQFYARQPKEHKVKLAIIHIFFLAANFFLSFIPILIYGTHNKWSWKFFFVLCNISLTPDRISTLLNRLKAQ
jgi:hypothetical protein